MIISSPEIMLNNHEETALAHVDSDSYFDTYQIAKEISMVLEEDFFERLSDSINQGTENNIKVIEELKNEIMMLRNEINSKDRDVLICDNAKLRMKNKDITIENLELKNIITDLEKKRKGFFSKIFNKD